MITSGIIELVTSVLSVLTGWLPSFTLPSWLNGSTILPSGVVTTLGNALGAISPVMPVTAILTVLSFLFALWPAIAGYIVFSWVWRHVPTIAGFGTGDG